MYDKFTNTIKMSFNDKLITIRDIFTTIRNAIIAKGVDIGECEGPDKYAEKILQITTCDPTPDDPDDPILAAGIICDDTGIIVNSQSYEKEVVVTYLRYELILEPEITNGSDWITIETINPGSISTYKVKISENTTTEERYATITFSCVGKANTAKHVINVTQSGKVEEIIPQVSVTCLNSSIDIPAEGDTVEVAVQYKNAISITNPTTEDWVELDGYEDEDQDSIKIRTYRFAISENNTNSDRTKTVIFSARGEDSSDSDSTILKQKKVVTPESVITYELKIEPKSLTIYKGDTGSFTLTADEYIDGDFNKTITVTTDATWKSSNSNVSVVRGEVTGLSIGTATITATYQDKTIDGTVTVVEKPADPVCKVTLNPTSVSLGYLAGSTATVQVTFENAEPHSVTSNEYCEITLGEEIATNVYKYNIKSLQNGGSSDRSTSVTITYTNLLTNATQNIQVPVTIAHVPSATISVNPTSINFTSGGGNKTATVTVTNTETYYTTKEDLDWLTLSTSGNVITLTVDPNESTSSRSGRVIVSCTGLDNVEHQAWINVTQDGKVVVEEPSPMYYGYIPTQLIIDHGLNKTDNWFENVTDECILEAIELGTITKVDQATTMGKTSFGVVPEDTMLLIAVPSGKYVVTKDDAFGNKMAFDLEPLSNGDYTTEIDGIAYTLYGEYQNNYIVNNKFFYID